MTGGELPDGPRDPHILHGARALGQALATLWGLAPAGAGSATGWATVELDRAEAEIRPAFASHGPAETAPAAPDDLLGARCRIARFADGFTLVLLEPSTEGRIAASLARFGEGAVVEYVVVPETELDRLDARARDAGLVTSREAPGPLGRQRLVLGGPAWGAHIVVAGTDRPGAAVATRRPGTITER